MPDSESNDSTKPADGTLNLNRLADRRKFLEIVSIGSMIGLAGCSGGNNDSNTANSGGDATTSMQENGKATLKTTLGNNLAGTFYGSTNIITESVTLHHLLYNTLVTREWETGELRPDVAKNLPEIKDNATTFTFDLREDVQFHNGDDLLAQDVKYSFDIMQERELANAGSFTFESIEVEDDYRITFNTTQPYSPWVEYGVRYMSIVREGIHEEVSSFPEDLNSGPKNGCNSGPFDLAEYEPQNVARFTAYDDYFRDGVPGVNEIEVTVIPDASAQNIAIRNGDVHSLGRPNPKDFESLESQSGVNGDEVPNPSSRITIYLSHKRPFNNVHLRKALSYAIPRKAIIDTIFFGHGFPSSIPAPPETWFYNADADKYGVTPMDSKVQDELDAAGMGDGFEFDIVVSSSAPHPDIAVLIQETLKNYGITMNIQQIDPGSFYGKIGSRDYTAGLEIWTSAINPDYYFASLFTEFGKFSDWHRWGTYSNEINTQAARAEITQMIRESRQYVDRDERAPYYRDILGILSDQLPYVWVGGTNILRLWRDNVQSFSVNPANWQNIRRTTLQ